MPVIDHKSILLARAPEFLMMLSATEFNHLDGTTCVNPVGSR